MKQKIQILPSGIALIDKAWGGLYRGGTYLLVGSHKSGRTTLALEFAKECIEQGEVCIYFTTRRPKDLILQAVSINIDLQNDISQNNLIVIRVDSAISLNETRDDDIVLAEYIRNIKGMVEKYQPAKIVFDELTPFLGFNDFNLLESTLAKTIEAIEDLGVTSLFIVGDPITATSKKVIDILAVHSTGIIYLEKKDDDEYKFTSGIMAITPNIGHFEGKFKSNYQIIPGKGFLFESQSLPSSRYYANGKSILTDSKYTSLSDLDLPKYEYLVSNLYNYEDFSLIINNQIAFYKSTGQVFTLVSFKVTDTAEKDGILSINQVRNAIRLSIEKKDKMCVVSNKVIVLLTKEDQKDIGGLISRVKNNLFAEDNFLLMKILSSVSVYALRVDESVNTSEDLLKELRSDELKGKNVFRFH
jgi:circadian clock protein KaiC